MAGNDRRQRYCGIYKILHIPTGCFYIGKSNDILMRWNTHLQYLFYKKHGNPHLQQLFDDVEGGNSGHNYSDFTFAIIKICKKLEVDELEVSTIEAEANRVEAIGNVDLLLNVTHNRHRKNVRKKVMQHSE